MIDQREWMHYWENMVQQSSEVECGTTLKSVQNRLGTRRVQSPEGSEGNDLAEGELVELIGAVLSGVAFSV